MVLSEHTSPLKKTVVLNAKAKYLELENKLLRDGILNKQTLIEPMMEHYVNLLKHRSSRPEVFCKKGVLRSFAKFLRTPFLTEHLRWLLLLAASSRYLYTKLFIQPDSLDFTSKTYCRNLIKSYESVEQRKVTQFKYHING